ncbi:MULTISPECIES: DNA adenine methylase [unclassified Bradyrhizobium]|uniref:DNA adenine methylase n=1 Tax=unclassified Bradyrhizobium TaxID=2631580 RepID=UPI00291713DA|nr:MULTISPECIES: DNA adenine methylase [unclassified Bradyrhizobium]
MKDVKEAVERFVPFRLAADVAFGSARIAGVKVIESGDLFNSLDIASSHLAQSKLIGGPSAIFTLFNGIEIGLGDLDAPSAPVQALIAAMSLESMNGSAVLDRAVMIDPNLGLTIRAAGEDIVARAVECWQTSVQAGVIDEVEVATSPKLYGSKLRLTSLIVGAAASVLPEGAPILDAMSGTGIASRKLASRFNVSANDANPYAAILTNMQQSLPLDLPALIDRLKEAAQNNLTQLIQSAPEVFAREAEFLHSEATDAARLEYTRFCNEVSVFSQEPPAANEPFRLVVGRYANHYFGLAQAAEIDSIRAAIDSLRNVTEAEREVCLAALLVAATVCTTGPHFAQPRQALSLRGFKEILERRSRSVLWEFELALRRLQNRSGQARPFRRITNLDWLDAVEQFDRDIRGSRPAAVYFDPPYSKLQYSRYYHVLNVLIAYDYPSVSGKGRYPPLAQRFSSRFEFNAGSAKREFERAFEACRSRDLHVLVSYSDTGFIPITDLAELLKNAFADVVVLSEPIRHHSQGVTLGDSQGKVNEFVLVARP